jgi:hypothetical protein
VGDHPSSGERSARQQRHRGRAVVGAVRAYRAMVVNKGITDVTRFEQEMKKRMADPITHAARL